MRRWVSRVYSCLRCTASLSRVHAAPAEACVQAGLPDHPRPLNTRVCTRRSVRSAVEFLTLVGRGLQLRAKQPTTVHAESSRSHLVITVTLAAAASPRGPGGRPSAPGQCPSRKARGTGGVRLLQALRHAQSPGRVCSPTPGAGGPRPRTRGAQHRDGVSSWET